MKKVVISSTAYGDGGLGQHFAHVLEQTRAAGQLDRYYSSGIKAGDEAVGERAASRMMWWLMRYTPVRYSAGWSAHLSGHLFDRVVARRLRAPIECVLGVSGQALVSFQRARALGCRRFELISPNSHVRNVARLHGLARRMFPIESSWLNSAQIDKTLREYEMADLIYVNSEYSRETFLAEGVSPSKLRRVHYPTDPRFTPGPPPSSANGFHVVYCGSVMVTKGIPLLLEALQRLPDPRLRLTLVGGTTTRAMKRYMAERIGRDPRITMAPGDPLPAYRAAHVCVHPSFEDGLAYAPLEAMACGAPVIVTETTGMKEYVQPGRNGWIVPAGSVDALTDAIRTAMR